MPTAARIGRPRSRKTACDPIVPDRPVTQKQFGATEGIGQSIVSSLVVRGHLLDGGTAADWLLDYCARLREQAAGRLGSGVP